MTEIKNGEVSSIERREERKRRKRRENREREPRGTLEEIRLGVIGGRNERDVGSDVRKRVSETHVAERYREGEMKSPLLQLERGTLSNRDSEKESDGEYCLSEREIAEELVLPL